MSEKPRESATLLVESQTGFEPIVLKSTSTIGRDRSKCDVIIDHPTTSRLHARIWKDGGGWHYQDLGSVNGTKRGDSRLSSIIDLADGTPLRIGRVQAYFFSAGVPDTWRPPEQAGSDGKLLRCRCGHIGFAPKYTLGMTLHCAKCGRDLVYNEPATPRVAVDCAACHTTIEPNERMHVCEECGAQMHQTCFAELGGCATYGCGKVKHDSPFDSHSTAPTESALDELAKSPLASEPTTSSNTIIQRDSIRFRLAQCGLFVLAGLPTFGIPAIAFAAYRLVTHSPSIGPMRFVYSILTFAGGAIGFVTSAYWWLGGPRPWKLL